jgi:glycosyltransferase 2 family protein
VRSHSIGRLVRILLSYGVGIGCLVWVLRGLRLEDVYDSVRQTDWPWLVPAALLAVGVYLCAGWEWQILLRPVGRLSVVRTTQAVLAGRFANDVLPVHVGYVLRVYLVSRWLRISVARIIPSLLLERFLDGLWLALGIGLMAIWVRLPGKIASAAEVWAGVMVFGLVALVAIIFYRRHEAPGVDPKRFDWRWFRRVRAFSGQVLSEIRVLGRSWAFWAAVAISILKFTLQALAFLLLLWAYGLHLSVWVQLGVFLIAYVGISIPSTPASVGVFQFFCISGLQLFGVTKAVATGFSLLAFVVLTIPLSIAGFVALAQSGVTLRQVREGLGDPDITQPKGSAS